MNKAKQRKVLVGFVLQNQADKTINVKVETYRNHPLYKKRYIYSKKYLVHDEYNRAKIGDKVEIISVRPISRRKCFRLSRILIAKTPAPAKAEV